MSWAPWVPEVWWICVAGDGDLVGGGWKGSYSVDAAGLWTPSNWRCHLWEHRHGPHVLDAPGPGWWVPLWH